MTQIVNDVNGCSLEVDGRAKMKIKLGDTEYIHNMIVCQMKPQGIISHDFLIKHVQTISYTKQVMTTEHGEIQCWTGGETCNVCRFFVVDTVKIPANTSTWINVKIPNGDHMSDIVHVHSISNQLNVNPVHVTDSIFSTIGPYSEINVMNSANQDVTVYSKTNIGVCESVECSGESRMMCAQVSCASVTSQEVPEYLADLLVRSSTHINKSEQEQFEQLLIEYQDVFSKSDDDLGCTNLIQHHINTLGADPIKQPFRRQPLGKREIERREVQKMLERGVIEPSISPWSSPIVLLTKKDGSTRFCVDFRAVNQLVKKDSFPLARIDECLESLAGSRYFSCMDLNQGYLQMG